jgi:hypothetical protein
VKPPLLDKRTRDRVLEQALHLAGQDTPAGWPGYVPDWTVPAEVSDPGHRLLQSFARLAELLIERLNQMPQRNFLSFLEFAGVERFPGAPAEVPATFVVSKRAPLGGIVPAGTQVATTQTKTSDSRVFETRRDFFATRAKLVSIVVLQPAENRFAVVPVPPTPPTPASLAAATSIRAFTTAEPALADVAHVLYVASEPLFARKAAADITLTLTLSMGAFPGSVTWRRFDKDAGAWVTLSPTVDSSVPGELRVTFPALAGVAKTTVEGVEDFWLAAHFTGTAAAIAEPPVISSITGAVSPAAIASVPLDAAFHNSSALDVSRPFLPFGPRPAYGDAFYFASRVAFSPENATVTLNASIRPFTDAALQAQFVGLPAGGMSVRTQARWQYLNANAQWVDLAYFDHEFQFGSATVPSGVTVSRTSHSPAQTAGEGTFIGTSSGDAAMQVVFPAFPADIGLGVRNGVENRWLRVLLTSERPYGNDGVLTGSGATARFVGPLFIPPRVDSLTATIVPRTDLLPMSCIKTLNNFLFSDHLASGGAIRPFVAASRHELAGSSAFGAAAALYCGFDRQLEPAAFISLYFDLAAPASSLSSPLESGRPAIAWEYWSAAGGWRLLDAADETLDLTTSGTVAFVAPRDAAPAGRFRQVSPQSEPDPVARWWLRARLASGSFDHPPALRGAYLNTVMTENRSTFPELLIGSSNGEPEQSIALVKGPVLAGDVWIRETERPSAQELLDLDAEHAEDESGGAPVGMLPSPNVREAGEGGEVWVRWRRRPNFRLSGSRSRHYLLDSVAAIVRLGNGMRGQIPAVGRNNIVFRGLQTGGGASANLDVAALSVKELKSSLPFIDKVFNVQAASAGASPWTVEQYGEFGPQSLKTRGRAVTTEDYAWMVRQRFSDVARVSCRAVSEPSPGGLQFKAGGTTTIIVPWSSEPRPQPSQGLIRKVREFLEGTVLTNIVGDVHVNGPHYVAVDIEATLVPTRPEFALGLARKAQEAIDAFLHPLTGGQDHRGYGFGRPVFLSEVYAALERIEEVDHVVTARFSALPGAEAYPVTGDRLASSGMHQLYVVGS